MSTNIGGTNIVIGANFGQVTMAYQEVTQTLQAFQQEINTTLNQTLKQTVQNTEAIRSGLPVYAMMAGAIQPIFNMLRSVGGQIRDTINATGVWNTEISRLAGSLGITAVEAGGLSQALNDLEISTDAYKSAVFMLQRSLDSQETAFNKNGIATRSANGEMLSIQQIMMNTIARLREMKPGYDANALAMMAFGKSAKDLQTIMNLTNEKIAEGADQVEQLGMTVTEDGVAKTEACGGARVWI